MSNDKADGFYYGDVRHSLCPLTLAIAGEQHRSNLTPTRRDRRSSNGDSRDSIASLASNTNRSIIDESERL